MHKVSCLAGVEGAYRLRYEDNIKNTFEERFTKFCLWYLSTKLYRVTSQKNILLSYISPHLVICGKPRNTKMALSFRFLTLRPFRYCMCVSPQISSVSHSFCLSALLPLPPDRPLFFHLGLSLSLLSPFLPNSIIPLPRVLHPSSFSFSC